MNKKYIASHQFFSLTANGAIGGSILVVASSVASVAKQDAWISVIWALIFGLPVIWMYWFLGSRYPGKNFVEIIQKILGKWVGLPISFMFVFACLDSTPRVLWHLSDFLTTEAMFETPPFVINLIFIIAIVIAILYGIEAIARTSWFLFLFASAFFILAIILVLPNVKIENIQPLFEKGMLPSLKGSVFLSSFITYPLVTLMMIYPININDLKRAKKSFFKGYLWAGLIIAANILTTILVLGSTITAESKYPAYLLAKEINLGDIFTRLEFLISASWFITQFTIGILFLYAGVIGLSQLLGLKDYKRIVLPIGLIVLIMTKIVYPTSSYQKIWISFVWTPHIFVIGLILPLCLLFVYLLKNGFRKHKIKGVTK